MGNILKTLSIGSMIILLTACTAAQKKEDEGAQAPDTATDADQRYGVEEGSKFQGHPLDDPDSPLSKRVVYFEFDSSELSTEDRETISAHAEYLSQNPGVSVVLEGHADERGTREYNIALGEKRAKGVQQLMTLQGVAPNQIQVISFGEERPVALGHDEDAWRLNRRVELLYSGY